LTCLHSFKIPLKWIYRLQNLWKLSQVLIIFISLTTLIFSYLLCWKIQMPCYSG